MMEPILEMFSEEQGDHVVVAKVNVDDEPTLGGRYNIRSIPTILFLKEGQEVGRVIGATSKSVLEQKLQELTISES